MATRRLYKTMQYTNKNTTEYLFKSHNAQRVNESFNVSLITRGVQEYGMNILFPFHNNGFYLLQENEKKEAETAG